jgi:hypothetical protein
MLSGHRLWPASLLLIVPTDLERYVPHRHPTNSARLSASAYELRKNRSCNAWRNRTGQWNTKRVAPHLCHQEFIATSSIVGHQSILQEKLQEESINLWLHDS